MTTKIYSKLDPTKLLHMIVRDIPEGRVNLCPEEQFLQCASLRLPKGTTFEPHKHNWQPNEPGMHVTQEAWVIIKGVVLVMYYDTDGATIGKYLIHQGEASFTFEGGHNYEIWEDDSVVYEVKTGPYISQQHDKTFL